MNSEVPKAKKSNHRNIIGSIFYGFFALFAKIFGFVLSVIGQLLQESFIFQALFAFFLFCVKIILLIATIAFLRSFIIIN